MSGIGQAITPSQRRGRRSIVVAMTKQILPASDQSWLILGAVLIAGTMIVAAFTGCLAGPPGQPGGDRGHAVVQVQATAAIQDDYDYYPGYETYYNPNRKEFVYRDGNAWVRRPEPAGVTAAALFTAPRVRLDFHDSPEQHHAAVVKQYPKNWKGQEAKPEVKDEKGDDKKDERKE